MAIDCIERKWVSSVDEYRCTYIMDSDEDAANLPKCGAGSMAVVADTSGKAYMVNASGEWSEV